MPYRHWFIRFYPSSDSHVGYMLKQWAVNKTGDIKYRINGSGWISMQMNTVADINMYLYCSSYPPSVHEGTTRSNFYHYSVVSKYHLVYDSTCSSRWYLSILCTGLCRYEPRGRPCPSRSCCFLNASFTAAVRRRLVRQLIELKQREKNTVILIEWKQLQGKQKKTNIINKYYSSIKGISRMAFVLTLDLEDLGVLRLFELHSTLTPIKPFFNQWRTVLSCYL